MLGIHVGSCRAVSQVETAGRLRGWVRFEGITLIFVAPEFSHMNMVNFLEEFHTLLKDKGVGVPVGTVFFQLDALAIVFLARSDPTQDVVLKSRDPKGEFERMLFDVPRLLEFIGKQKQKPEGLAKLGQYGGLLVTQDVVEGLLHRFYEKRERYAPYFERYRALVHEG